MTESCIRDSYWLKVLDVIFNMVIVEQKPGVSYTTGTGTIIPAYPLSPSMLLYDFLCGNLAKFAFIIKKSIISDFTLCSQSLKSAHKHAFYGEMTCLAIMGIGSDNRSGTSTGPFVAHVLYHL